MASEDDQEGGEQADPRARLMQEVAAQMDAIEADFGDNYEIGNVVIIVEVQSPAGAAVRVRSNAPPWVGIGMLRTTEKILDVQAAD